MHAKVKPKYMEKKITSINEAKWKRGKRKEEGNKYSWTNRDVVKWTVQANYSHNHVNYVIFMPSVIRNERKIQLVVSTQKECTLQEAKSGSEL